MAFTNNVTRLLRQRRVPHTVHTYPYGPEAHSAVQVAQILGLPPVQVFKTLVVEGARPDTRPILALIPGPATLDTRKLARAAGEKKVRMATRDRAEALTGLQAGGISPLALLQRRFRVFLDRQAMEHPRIYLSAGQRGAQVGLAPEDLIRLTQAQVADLCVSEEG